MLDAEMNQCYWDLLPARYSRWDRYLKFFIAFAASGAVAGWGIWSQYPGGWKAGGPLKPGFGLSGDVRPSKTWANEPWFSSAVII